MEIWSLERIRPDFQKLFGLDLVPVSVDPMTPVPGPEGDVDAALTAIERFGAWKGGWLALWRILRCNPFCKGGYDPVPSALDTTIRRE